MENTMETGWIGFVARVSEATPGEGPAYRSAHAGYDFSICEDRFNENDLALMNRIQHDHRYLALGLERIVGIRRPEFERLFPKSAALLAGRRPGPRAQLLGSDLNVDFGVGEDVAIPTGVLGR